MPLLLNRVKCAVPNPGSVDVGSTITLGAAPSNFKSFLTAAGGGEDTYFTLTNGADRTIRGIWTINATSPETATIVEIISNDRLGGTAGETFSGACTAWCWLPAEETLILRDGPLAGFRNLIINGNPTINQRAYVSAAATGGANEYTLDRWRVVTSGQAVSWTSSAGVRAVTAPAGGMEQVIEGASILGGVHTLSWQGSGTATVNGSPVANGGQVTLTGGSNATVRMTGGPWSLLQLEPGPKKTPFERRPIGVEIALCKRYFWALPGNIIVTGSMFNGQNPTAHQSIWFPATMRVAPTANPTWASGSNNLGQAVISLSVDGAQAQVQGNGIGDGSFSIILSVCTFTAEL